MPSSRYIQTHDACGRVESGRRVSNPATTARAGQNYVRGVRLAPHKPNPFMKSNSEPYTLNSKSVKLPRKPLNPQHPKPQTLKTQDPKPCLNKMNEKTQFLTSPLWLVLSRETPLRDVIGYPIFPYIYPLRDYIRYPISPSLYIYVYTL